ncbi:MAG: hypothetical protein E6300_01730 [Clostridium sp.]|uniref:hypothetical protein n=1 Tax=Clostridium sp. TaxID=1506 RepID=UPI00290CF73F|nr:hypothetical protein [Clostridium sp.]MDU7147187.1 hypothetical protein [Clostridium sp.]
MAFKDYLKFFSTEGIENIDYIIVFKNGRLEIKNNPNLIKLGQWREYGDNGYRIICPLSKENFEKIIIDELGVKKEDFQLVRAAEFAGLRF